MVIICHRLYLLSKEMSVASENKKTIEAYAWLMKSEPGECSIDDVLAMKDQTVGWFGVRNYQARNFMRDQMRIGQPVLFYHSSCKEPGIVGVAEVAGKPYPDPTQFDKTSEYFDPKSTEEKPRWQQVDVKVLYKVQRISLDDLKKIPACQDMQVLKRGNRLSITPITKKEWDAIEELFRRV